MARSPRSHLLAGTSPARLPSLLEARSLLYPLPRESGRVAPDGRRVSDHPGDVGRVQGARMDNARRAGFTPSADVRGVADLDTQRPKLGPKPAVAEQRESLRSAVRHAQ